MKEMMMAKAAAAPAAKKQTDYGDTKAQVVELLRKRPLSINQICEIKGWPRHVVDYAITRLKTEKLVRELRHEMIARQDGRGHVKVMMFELADGSTPMAPKEAEEAEAPPTAVVRRERVANIAPPAVVPVVRPGNVQVVSNRDLLDEYATLLRQQAKLDLLIEQVRARLEGAL